jgi:hypothetical protein
MKKTKDLILSLIFILGLAMSFLLVTKQEAKADTCW